MSLGYIPRFFSIALLVEFVFIVVGLVNPQVTHAGSWSPWTKRSSPVWTGQYGIAADPSLLVDGNFSRMFYTCLDPITGRTLLCQATSQDGFSWHHAATGTATIRGRTLAGRKGSWEENLESTFMVKQGTKYLLYYAGYRDVGTIAKGFPSALGVAQSTDGLSFSRVTSSPILSPTAGWYDNDAIYSPTIIQVGTSLVMIYVGHCYTNCSNGMAVTLLAATSTDGITWKKQSTPVLKASPSIPWMQEGVAEPSVMRGLDGAYYLFFTGLDGESRAIGVARSSSVYGPWQINPQPIVTSTPGLFDEVAAIAPYVRIESNRVRLWYMGWNSQDSGTTGYAESSWPLYQ